MTKDLLFSVKLSDCEVETKRGSGKGGQNRNKRDSAVKIIHPPSGAIGESQEERSQLQNKRTAWQRMVNSPKFQLWVKRQAANEDIIKAQVERDMWPVNLKTEVQQDGKWVRTRDL